jgi:hypothetical protein
MMVKMQKLKFPDTQQTRAGYHRGARRCIEVESTSFSCTGTVSHCTGEDSPAEVTCSLLVGGKSEE